MKTQMIISQVVGDYVGFLTMQMDIWTDYTLSNDIQDQYLKQDMYV
jgi:hypothetical protein